MKNKLVGRNSERRLNIRMHMQAYALLETAAHLAKAPSTSGFAREVLITAAVEQLKKAEVNGALLPAIASLAMSSAEGGAA